MKRYGNLFGKVCDYSVLHSAFKRAFRGSGRTDEACRFCFHLEKELLLLKEEIVEGSYKPAPYRYFRIYDPKERVISVAGFRDRVVHHAIVGILEPIFEPVFIYDSYATRKGKGSHRAVSRAQSFLKKHTYYLKMDIDKYFDNIDHQILLDLIQRKIKDKSVLELMERIIKNSDISRGLAAGKGLPIGNLTSQFFANVYLNPLDHFLKDIIGERAYIRYMDDMIVFSDSREHLKIALKKIDEFLTDNLKLKLKERATIINAGLHGLPFLGHRVFPNLIRVKKENLKRVGKRLLKRLDEYHSGAITEGELAMSVRSWFEFVGFADSLSFRQAYLAPMSEIRG